MIVTGLNGNRFLGGNPIPIGITLDSGSFEQGYYITMNITRLPTHPGDIVKTFSSTLFPKHDGIQFDLSYYIKGMLLNPYIPGTSYQDPVPNYQNFNITFSENQTDTSATFLNKTFVRGFKRLESLTAMTLSVNQQLSPVDKIPVWQGFPTARFWIDSGNAIRSTEIVDAQYVKQMRLPVTCDPFYLRFLNSLGGYSFWMFNSWEWQTKGTALGVIPKNVTSQNRSLGFTEENNVTVDTRVKREFYPLIRDMIVSPVIQVYDKFGLPWKKIELKGNSITENNYDDMIEVTATFDLMLNNKPQVPW